MNPDNDTSDTLVDGAQLTPANGGENVDTALTLNELNSFLGRNFKDKDSALNALKETQNFVGKRKEDIADEVRKTLTPAVDTAASSSLEQKLSSLEKQLYFSQHPELKGYEAIIEKMGSNPAEVVESAEFKTVFEKGTVADTVAQQRSVAPSNSRLAQVKSVTDEAVLIANARGSTNEDVALSLARGINSDLSS